IARQTFPRSQMEVLVLDDASQDASADIADALLRQAHLPGRVIRNESNAGVSVTRNRGWGLARGEWIQFIDADDLLQPDKLHVQAEVARGADERTAVVYSDWQHLRFDGTSWHPSLPLREPYVDDDPVVRILQDLWFGYVGPVLMRR